MKKIKDLTKDLRRIEVFTNKKVDDDFAGNYKSSFKGQGLEVDDLRRYEDGDDAKYIDWITTAKSGIPFVKKYKETRELSTMILVDTSATMNFGSTVKNKKEVAIELIATILFSCLKNNDKFGVIIFSGDKVSFIPPKKGKTHLLRILKDCLLAYSKNNKPRNNLNQALQILMSVVKRRGVCFLITDKIEEESSKLLGVVSKKYDLVYIRLNDPFEQGIAPKGIFKVENVVSGEIEIIDLNKQKTLDNFRKLRAEKIATENQILKERKIDCLPVLTNSNVYKELIMFFKKRQLRV